MLVGHAWFTNSEGPDLESMAQAQALSASRASGWVQVSRTERRFSSRPCGRISGTFAKGEEPEAPAEAFTGALLTGNPALSGDGALREGSRRRSGTAPPIY